VAKLENRVAFVTGGASGLGKAIARRLAAEGAKVVIGDIQSDAGWATAAELGITFLEQDVTDEQQWVTVIDRIVAKHGALHILVNNAGIEGQLDCSNPENIRLSDWKSVQSVNVEGVLLGCRTAIPVIRRSGGGVIINLSSVASENPGPDTVAYGASKAAVRHITTSVAIHCARTGSKIRCNSVHPGIALTAMVRRCAEGVAKRLHKTTDQVLAEMKSGIPQGEFTEPEDVANAVLFLASDEAKHITGAKLMVDGGYACR
jgi:3(or 17)beta-hydroxysteroid dehydrogenase